MNVSRFFHLAFGSPEVPADVQPREDEAMHAIVAAHSHGNLRLQQGLYYTEEDVNERRKKIARADFSPTA